MGPVIKLVIVLIGFTLTTADETEDLLTQTTVTSNSFACAVPQRRAVRISSLVESRTHDTFSPTHVILTRCDDMTGVCKERDKLCAPVGLTEKVKVAFIVTNQPLNTINVQSFEAENHLQCGCMKSEDWIK